MLSEKIQQNRAIVEYLSIFDLSPLAGFEMLEDLPFFFIGLILHQAIELIQVFIIRESSLTKRCQLFKNRLT